MQSGHFLNTGYAAEFKLLTLIICPHNILKHTQKKSQSKKLDDEKLLRTRAYRVVREKKKFNFQNVIVNFKQKGCNAE